MRRRSSIWLALLVLLALPGPAAAEDGRWADRQWSMPRPELQADMDPTLVPVGRAAVLLPAMSDPLQEPPYQLRQHGITIGSAAPGTRIIAPPGEYTVRFGSGTSADLMTRKVVLREGKTTIVEPDWAGLAVQVLDRNGIPHRGTYELLALPELESYGVGLGAQVEQGERIRTWILPPGTYLFLKPGETYQARQNFYTFRVRPGYLERIVLVIDPDTGDFLGAGEPPYMAERIEVDRELFATAVIGGGLSLAIQQGVLGVADQTTLGPSFYVESLMRYEKGMNYVYGRLNLEEAFTQEDWGRFEKNIDFIRLDTLYALKLLPWFGPYVRFGLESAIFPGHAYFDSPRDVQYERPDGSIRRWEDVEQVWLSDPFTPLVLKGGTGLRFNTLPNPWFDVWALLGVGTRATLTGDLLVEVAGTSDPVELVHRESTYQSGIDSSIVGRAILTRWVIYNSEFEIFAPFTDFARPTLRWDNNVSLRITSFVSINYVYRMRYEPEIIDRLQHDHQALLRFSYQFL